MIFKKDKWLVTDIERVTTPVNLNSPAFKQEYYDLLAKNNGEVIKTVEKLSLRYPWIPQEIQGLLRCPRSNRPASQTQGITSKTE